MDKKNPTELDIHALFQARFSPYAIDPDKDVKADDVKAMFEAARWAMSSYNAQPWSYIIASKSRDRKLWDQLHALLLEGNQPWAVNAPVLAIGLTKTNFAFNGQPNKAHAHDLGAASAFATLEATRRGLVVHQMIGINVDGIKADFDLEDDIEPFTALAIGYAGKPEHVGEVYQQRDSAPRSRKPLDDMILKGNW